MTSHVEKCPNPNCVTIHVDVRLSQCWGDKVPMWARRIMGVDGVEGVTCFESYDFNVKRGVLFSWDDITPKIEAILREELT